jgi:DNA repair ATPase RecN
LTKKQKREVAKVQELENETEQLRSTLTHLESYLQKLQAPKGNSLTKSVRAEIKDITMQTKKIQKQVQAIKEEIKRRRSSTLQG